MYHQISFHFQNNLLATGFSLAFNIPSLQPHEFSPVSLLYSLRFTSILSSHLLLASQLVTLFQITFQLCGIPECVCLLKDRTATRWVLDGPGIESQWRAILSAPVQTGPGTHPDLFTTDTRLLLGVKVAAACD